MRSFRFAAKRQRKGPCPLRSCCERSRNRCIFATTGARLAMRPQRRSASGRASECRTAASRRQACSSGSGPCAMICSADAARARRRPRLLAILATAGSSVVFAHRPSSSPCTGRLNASVSATRHRHAGPLPPSPPRSDRSCSAPSLRWSSDPSCPIESALVAGAAPAVAKRLSHPSQFSRHSLAALEEGSSP